MLAVKINYVLNNHLILKITYRLLLDKCKTLKGNCFFSQNEKKVHQRYIEKLSLQDIQYHKNWISIVLIFWVGGWGFKLQTFAEQTFSKKGQIQTQEKIAFFSQAIF